jgi:hypothetical protein
MKVEIVDKLTSRVVETMDVGDIQAWRFYWRSQCDREAFGWRAVLRKIHHPVGPQSQQPEQTVPMTTELVNEISEPHGGLSTASVSDALLRGEPVFALGYEYRLA